MTAPSPSSPTQGAKPEARTGRCQAIAPFSRRGVTARASRDAEQGSLPLLAVAAVVVLFFVIAVLLEPFAPALALGIGVSRAAASRRSKASPAVPAEVASFAWRASIAAGAEASPTATAVAPAATSSARVAAARAAEAASSCAVAAGVATRRFLLRRVYFPEQPSAEWFAVDLLRHHEMAGVPLSDLLHGLVLALRERRWDGNKLHELAETYGTKTTLACVDKCIAEARAA